MTAWTYVGGILSFVVFVVILYYLLYRPVGRILKERKDAMEADLRKAEQLNAEAQQARADADQHEKELEEKRDAIIKQATDQAEKHRKDVLKETEQQARARIERFRRVLKQERDDLLDNVTDDLRTTILHVARAVIGDDARLTDRSLDRIESLLNEMSGEDLESARKALDNPAHSLETRSAAPLSPEQQGRLKKILAAKLGTEEFDLDLKDDPSLLAGIDLTLGHINLAAHWQSVVDEALQNLKPEPENPPQESPSESQS